MADKFSMQDYVDVAERLTTLREKHPEASLQPANLAKPYEIVTVADATFVVYVAACYRTPDDPCPGIGVAWERVPGLTPYTKNSELQNAETSAWGRAIVAALAADTKRGIASAQEVRGSQTRPDGKGGASPAPSGQSSSTAGAPTSPAVPLPEGFYNLDAARDANLHAHETVKACGPDAAKAFCESRGIEWGELWSLAVCDAAEQLLEGAF